MSPMPKPSFEQPLPTPAWDRPSNRVSGPQRYPQQRQSSCSPQFCHESSHDSPLDRRSHHKSPAQHILEPQPLHLVPYPTASHPKTSPTTSRKRGNSSGDMHHSENHLIASSSRHAASSSSNNHHSSGKPLFGTA
ncbi:hypothetical protein B0H34DRAFT_860497 [Crassisporium funariophilum]|nr:hypothetical protein B0H34DRAFT_860497 [Crassisporium funariophilum]